jgi:hypothetical protein
MNAKIHEVVEGIQYQGVDEEITYDIDTANWGGSPSSVTVVVKDVANNYADVTATVMPAGSPSVSSDTITLPELKSLTMDKHYRIEVKFTISGNIMECYVPVIGTR